METETGYNPAYDDYTSEEYPPDWEGRRKVVLDRDGYTCRGCGVRSTRVDGIPFDVDHIIPKSDGGSHGLSNLQTLCRACHAEKHPDNAKLARRARKWKYRNTRSVWVRLLRVLLVVPLLLDLFSTDNSREITDEHGRTLELTTVESVPDLPIDRGVTLDARVATLWDSDSKSIQQVGLLVPANSSRTDDVTTIKFVVWSGNNLPEMKEDGSYRLIGALTDEYNGRAEVKLDGRSEIRPLR